MTEQMIPTDQEMKQLREELDALRPLAEEHRLMVDNIRDYALISFDSEGRIKGWSTGAERLIGFRKEEALGKPASIFFVPDDIAAGEPQRELAKATQDGRAEDERWHARKDGTRFWGSGVVTSMRDGAGDLQGYLKIVRDLTARKKAEDALRQSEEKLRRFVENVTDYALIQVDREGNITSWNRGAQRIFGYREAEILNNPVSIFFEGEDRSANVSQQQLTEALQKGRAEYERWMTRKDKTRFLARCVVTPIHGDSDELLGFAKVLRDETERRKSEERLRASLIERDALIKEIHHRVKNNLQVIVSLLRLQSDQITDPTALTVFNEMQTRVRAIAQIHETLYSSVDLANIEFGNYTRALIQDLCAFYDVDCDRIQLHLDTQDLVLEITQAIPLGLILNELVVNAFKHAFPEGRAGNLDVSLRYLDDSIRANQTLDEGLAQLCVADDGVGLRPDFSFENAGTMGMYLIRLLTRQLQAKISFEQSPGTRVCVTFPLSLDASGEMQ